MIARRMRSSGAAFAILIVSVVAIAACNPQGPAARLERALRAKDTAKALAECQSYFERSAAAERDQSVPEKLHTRCAERFAEWFQTLPEELDDEAVAKIEKMTWIDAPYGKEEPAP